jgi:hypothetical protein
MIVNFKTASFNGMAWRRKGAFFEESLERIFYRLLEVRKEKKVILLKDFLC